MDSQKGGGSSFIYLAGQRIAEDHWNCGSNTHTATYFHSDALGSLVATTDAAKNVLDRTYYAPYGEALNRSVDGPGYTGHIMDAATGLVYAQQRYYDPVVGKFLSIDPVAADPSSGGNFNRYWYANNNPYKFTDPDGRCAEPDSFGCRVSSAIARSFVNNETASRDQVGAVTEAVSSEVEPTANGLVAAGENALIGAGVVAVVILAPALLEGAGEISAALTATTEAANALIAPVVTEVITNPAVIAGGSFVANNPEVVEDVASSVVSGLTGAQTPSSTPQGFVAGVISSEIKDKIDK